MANLKLLEIKKMKRNDGIYRFIRLQLNIPTMSTYEYFLSGRNNTNYETIKGLTKEEFIKEWEREGTYGFEYVTPDKKYFIENVDLEKESMIVSSFVG